MSIQTFPTRQSELIRQARGQRTQAEFAKLLGVDRSCLSRYEREQLGAPTSVINQDRKSTRLNSSHSQISYAVFCLKKKKSRRSARAHARPAGGRAAAHATP